MKLSKKGLDKIINDKELQPLFINYIGENLKMNMAMFCHLRDSNDIHFKRDTAKYLVKIIKRLEGKIDEEDLYPTIDSVCRHYLQYVWLSERP